MPRAKAKRPVKKARKPAAKKKGRSPKGRPSGLTEQKIATIKKLAQHGFLANEIADILNVTRMTFWRWRATVPEVTAALAIGHESANDRVELSVYQMAIGYDREEEEIKVVNGVVERIPVRKYYPPSPAAAAMWTRNKMAWGADIAPPSPMETTEPQQIEVRQIARQVARLFHLAEKETQQ